MSQAAKFTSFAFLWLGVCAGWGAQGPVPPWHGKAEAPPPQPPSVATFKVNVDLVLVEVGVHDEHGRAVGNLTREDFQVFEDGQEQEIRAFSHEQLPLAVALVIDNSSSIMAALHELRMGALATLALLKRDDQVAIFSFGAKPELVEGLTTDHEALSVDLWALSPYGGTALNDGVYEAALYLGRAAPVSRRAVILVSDNEPSDEETRTVPEVVRAAQQSGTPVYSVKVGNLEHSKTFFLLHSEPRMHDVEKICKQTGGELIDTRTGTTVSAAMQTILTWLKQGYTLGYSPSNKRRDGSYRTIEVRLNGPGAAREHKYRTYARPGYYAPAGP